MPNIVGLFDSRFEAHSTVQQLVNSGFDREDISLVSQDTDREVKRRKTHPGISGSDSRRKMLSAYLLTRVHQLNPNRLQHPSLASTCQHYLDRQTLLATTAYLRNNPQPISIWPP